MTSGRILALGAILLLDAIPAPAQIDPFYLDLEREAQVAATRGDVAGAARLLRVACFGMLDEPPRLAACTVRLARAQAAVKDIEGFRASFLRLATVEERFQGLTGSGLPVDEVRQLARLAAAWLPATDIALIPSVADMIAAERTAKPAAAEPKAPSAKEKSRRRRTEAPPVAVAKPVVEAEIVSPPESAVEDPSGAPGESGAVAPSPVALAEVPASELFPAAPTEATIAASTADQERLEAARRRLGERPERATIEGELAAVRAISEKNPGDAVAARLAGDLAYLLGLWPTCAEFYQRAGDPGPEQPLGRFYMAVCLYETGQTESAALLIAPSADRLKRSPFVDGYLDRILGRDAPP